MVNDRKTIPPWLVTLSHPPPYHKVSQNLDTSQVLDYKFLEYMKVAQMDEM